MCDSMFECQTDGGPVNGSEKKTFIILCGVTPLANIKIHVNLWILQSHLWCLSAF